MGTIAHLLVGQVILRIFEIFVAKYVGMQEDVNICMPLASEVAPQSSSWNESKTTGGNSLKYIETASRLPEVHRNSFKKYIEI